jgi:hypothetical protein
VFEERVWGSKKTEDYFHIMLNSVYLKIFQHKMKKVSIYLNLSAYNNIFAHISN